MKKSQMQCFTIIGFVAFSTSVAVFLAKKTKLLKKLTLS